MSRAGRALLVGLALLAAALWAADLVATGVVSREAVRARILAGAREALGREVAYASAEVGLLPPSVVVRELRVAGPVAEAPALLEAPEVVARVALLPLLAGVVVVDAIEARGPVVRLAIDADGFDLPDPTGGADADAGAGADAKPPMLPRALRVADARFELEDRLRSPPVAWQIEQIDGVLALEGEPERLALSFAGRDPTGGEARASGTLARAGAVDLDVSFVDYPIHRAIHYLDVGDLSGRASGRARLRGALPAPDVLDVALDVSDGRFAAGAFELAGPFALRAAMAGGETGRLELEAGAAQVRVASILDKQPGEPGRLLGRLRRVEGGLRLDDLSLALGPISADGSAGLHAGGELALEGAVAVDDARVPFTLAGREDAGAWQLDLAASTGGGRVEGLLAALGRPDVALLGVLAFEAKLGARVLGGTPLADALAGDLRLRIAPGEMRGVSILRATLRALDRAVAAGLLRHLPLPEPGRLLGGDLDRHDTDAFHSLSASLRVAEGAARTQDFRLEAPSYVFTMQGAIGLADGALDARGELRIGGALTGALARQIGLARLPVASELVIPIPRLGGTLLDPDPQPDPSVLVRLVTDNLPGGRAAGKLLRGLGERLDLR